ncbi:MAG: DUF6443 domain-containing protein, partial [Flavobacteriaceae bacterium]
DNTAIDHCPDLNDPNNPQPRYWYADLENNGAGDGLGDPNVRSALLCEAPTGYVANSDDLCPDIASSTNDCTGGGGGSNSCATGSVPYTGNYVGHNYTYVRTYQRPVSVVPMTKFLDSGDYVQEITYFDGLGRPVQQNAVRQSPLGNDIVTHMAYDDLGRMDKEWLPMPMPLSSHGDFKGGDQAGRTATYYKDHNVYGADFTETMVNPYSEKLFEPSPLDRVLKQAAPGADWALNPNGEDHSIEFGHHTNAGDQVRMFHVLITVMGTTYTPTLQLHTGTNATLPEHYAVGELGMTITKDENHPGGNTKLHTTEEFTNKQGQVVLKRTYADVTHEDGSVSEAEPHDTYYVYDDYGNLTYVLPPKMEGNTATLTELNTNMDHLGYQYVYDDHNRLVEKKLPGKGWEYIVYNTLDQPIMTQDANMRAQETDNDQWLFTKYDAHGRVAYTGTTTVPEGTTRVALQSEVDDHITLWEDPEGDFANGGIQVGYSNDAYPYSPTEEDAKLAQLTEVLTITYYDDHSDLSEAVAPDGDVFEQAVDGRTQGLPTGSKVKVLTDEGDFWITTATWYDTKARPIYTYAKNTYLGTVDVTESKLDFSGRPDRIRTVHTRILSGAEGEENTVVTLDFFEYDAVGRLLAQTQCVGNDATMTSCSSTSVEAHMIIDGETVTNSRTATASITVTDSELQGGAELFIDPDVDSTGGELIVHNQYDALGQLTQKKVGGEKGDSYGTTSGLQTVDYTYTVRGWLKQINDPAQLQKTNEPKDLFAFGINYNTVTENASRASALYNGNISETFWKTGNDDTKRSYSYQYDALNRLTAGYASSGNYNLLDVSYDKVGNIMSLTRNGWQDGSTFANMDVLDYQYANSGMSNKLMKVTDTGNIGYGFKDGNTAGDDYVYDPNGNLTFDANKGITSISYNHLGLPTKVTINSSDGGTVDYVYDADGVKLRKVVSTGSTVDYAGNYIYENGVLQFFDHEEGYVTPNGSGGFDYVYQYLDHLGNIRLSYTDADGNGSIDTTNEIIEENNYYPFGLSHRGYNNNVSSLGNSLAQRWKFGGNELQEGLSLGWYDITARNYDPAIGRWMNIDPLAEEMRRFSPYAFAFNNPTYFIDPDGMMPIPNPYSLLAIQETIRDVAYVQQASTDNIALERLDGVTVTGDAPEGPSAFNRFMGNLAMKAIMATANVGATKNGEKTATIGTDEFSSQLKEGGTSILDLTFMTMSAFQASRVSPSSNNKSTNTKTPTSPKNTSTSNKAPVTNEIYKRPNNATTPAQRASVQNQPCVDCGGTSPTMRADHKVPLVEEHYNTGTIDKTRMRSVQAVQPQCETCSNIQGGKMSAYSKKMKKIIKNRTKEE